MATTLKKQLIYATKMAFTFAPWILAMYLFYWLESSQVWTAETPHRGKMSVLLLATGMLLSFLIRSWFYRRERK